jgi:hypothetical protein
VCGKLDALGLAAFTRNEVACGVQLVPPPTPAAAAHAAFPIVPLTLCAVMPVTQGMSPAEYEAQKVAVADDICKRLEAIWPGLSASIEFREVRGLTHTMVTHTMLSHYACVPQSHSSLQWAEGCNTMLTETSGGLTPGRGSVGVGRMGSALCFQVCTYSLLLRRGFGGSGGLYTGLSVSITSGGEGPQGCRTVELTPFANWD